LPRRCAARHRKLIRVNRASVPATLAIAVVAVTAVALAVGRPLPWYAAGGGVLVAGWAIIAAALARSKRLLAVGLVVLLGAGALAIAGVVRHYNTGPDDLFGGFGPRQPRPDAR
jgi:hypothetical protein